LGCAWLQERLTVHVVGVLKLPEDFSREQPFHRASTNRCSRTSPPGQRFQALFFAYGAVNSQKQHFGGFLFVICVFSAKIRPTGVNYAIGVVQNQNLREWLLCVVTNPKAASIAKVRRPRARSDWSVWTSTHCPLPSVQHHSAFTFGTLLRSDQTCTFSQAIPLRQDLRVCYPSQPSETRAPRTVTVGNHGFPLPQISPSDGPRQWTDWAVSFRDNRGAWLRTGRIVRPAGCFEISRVIGEV
jgi:hypothetical protein